MTVSTFDPADKTATVSMTDAAVRYFLKKLTEAADDKQVLRLSTQTSGCTGYAYVLDMVAASEQGDEVIDMGQGVVLAIDPKAAPIIKGTQIDLVTEGVNRVVKFNNPNVVAECGCGESFSVSDN